MALQKVVAILDVDPGALTAAARMASSHGYRVRPFSSTIKFVEAMAMSLPDCLVTDIHPDDHRGLDLVHLLFSVDIKIPVIFMTGSNDDALRCEAMALGCTAYLQKPFSAELMMAALERAMRPDLQ